MADQLVLLDPTTLEWRLDETTRERGRRGVQQAREALRQAARRPASAAA